MRILKGRVKELTSGEVTVATDEGVFEVLMPDHKFKILQRVELVLSDRNEVQYLRAR